MARSRNIKPGFFLNDELATLHPLARIIFIGLWCIADREGRLEDKPKKIKAEILPYDDCDTDELLNKLQELNFIHRYEVEGNKYIQVVNFNKHQNPHPAEKKSSIPKALRDSNLITLQETENKLQKMLIPDSLLSDSLILIPDPLVPEESAAADIVKEFGRPLSPMEADHVGQWGQRHPREVIMAAVKIAAVKGIHNIAYIDKILLGWEQSGIKTIEQVEDHERRRSAGRQKAPPARSPARPPAGNLTTKTVNTKGLYEI